MQIHLLINYFIRVDEQHCCSPGGHSWLYTPERAFYLGCKWQLLTADSVSKAEFQGCFMAAKYITFAFHSQEHQEHNQNHCVITAGVLTSFWLSLSNYCNITKLKFWIVFVWRPVQSKSAQDQGAFSVLSTVCVHFHCRETSLLLLLERCYVAPYCQASSTLTCHNRFPPDVLGLFPIFKTIKHTADLKLLFLILFVVTVQRLFQGW